MRNNFFKALAAIVLLVILGFFATTWYSSTKVDEQVTQRTEHINATLRDNDLPAQISTEKKDAGLFSTHYIVSLHIDSGKQSHVLDFDVVVEHGPLPLTRLQQGKLKPVQALSHITLIKNEHTAGLFKLSQDQTPLQMQLLTDFGGNTNYKGNLTSLSHNDDKGQLHFDGMTFEGTVNEATTLAEFSGVMPLLQFTLPKDKDGTGTVLFRDMKISSVYDNRDTANPVSNQQSSMAEFSLTNDTVNVQARDYQNSLSADTKNEQTTISSDTKWNALRINSVDLGSLQYGLSAEKLNPAATKQFFDASWQVLLGNIGLGDRDSEHMASLSMATALSQMFSGHPDITVGPILWTLPEGAAKASVKLGLNNPLPLLSKYLDSKVDLLVRTLRSVNIEFDADQAMPAEAARHLAKLASGSATGDKDLSADETAKKMTRIINILVDNKLLAQKDGHIALTANVSGEKSLLDAKQVEMNGESFEIDKFVQTLQERAAAAEQQIGELSDPEPELEDGSRDQPEAN